ncbi:MAG: Holliday junction branch migration protein RuvA [Zymomonas mobilis subsp. pomaceae]|uniref:Holliday junction branch migration complex subunit RuvA n=1 Tax=Zymomonas mobilis subsp. pomaceae (strain ATCC 29192 / DSM 22645 / JCM 10191 / CCUG 17912 / NBRC 13757 / NCIMB 11200 / NRRL B-4491 / Barker I) TaxID=579138 RepID=F8ETB9_ZYMMT|nr:Holliday junction branch migration protein RuvA [Zymomonas mobilis]AEI37944.1 Holliday junction DNA helicase RuvA [Zymomonas mobilis subsp. pomaceae ATCC 29192]MDX5949312.1 Holliday junction branch migration protein RuvA [Zymomonas mobilis subsp. pomaceae]GEB89681.1 Holliday junction ATP-dependent DNA helicase RuvA [Zymomonas mobilis subsp. pomaceae]
MIARLVGFLAEANADSAIIDVNGVGYLVQLSGRSLEYFATIEGEVTVHIETQVREEAITLYGFSSLVERDWFRLLTSVQGVGGRGALAILTVLTPEAIAVAISSGDKAMVTRANGIGPKIAQRIVNELKDKAAASGLLSSLKKEKLSVKDIGGKPSSSNHDFAADAVSALLNLGFRPSEAQNAVNTAIEELGETATLDALVRLALRLSSKH